MFVLEFCLVNEQTKLLPLTVTLDEVIPREGFVESNKTGENPLL